jgi:hypothetical protein
LQYGFFKTGVGYLAVSVALRDGRCAYESCEGKFEDQRNLLCYDNSVLVPPEYFCTGD